jgi:hypothetical protein
MLEVYEGTAAKFCDGISRRNVLRVGVLAPLGLALADLLRLQEAQAAQGRPAERKKAVLLLWQHGGPSHLDTYDLKPDMPEEVRGPYQPIPTNVDGIRISDRFPLQAKVMDRLTIHRGFCHRNDDHFAAAHWILTGYLGATGAVQTPKSPSIGSIVSRTLGPNREDVPPYVIINDGGFGYHGAAWLGQAYHPIRTGMDSYGNEGPQLPVINTKDLTPGDGITPIRLQRRRDILKSIDTVRRAIDPALGQMDAMQRKAIEMVLSARAYAAFDVSKEEAKIRELYGPGWGEQALIARRLIEAGVTFVTLNTGYWDDHGNIKGRLDSKLPRQDRVVHSLVTDLSQRGMLEDVLIVQAGEFGRTPKVNQDAGRDHWARAQSILIAGGRYRHGQVIGRTTKGGEDVDEDPMKPEDIGALIYHHLGIDPATQYVDHVGRPVYILNGGQVPAQLL